MGHFKCGGPGFVERSFELQEPGERWEPYLKGAIPLGEPGDTYQPFVFLVSYKPDGPATDVWFSYYKDLRDTGGRLKLGYGPGGPPVLGSEQLLGLVKKLIEDFFERQQACNKFTIGALLSSEPVVAIVRRTLRQLTPGLKVTAEEIAETITKEVVKREILFSEEGVEARKKLNRALKKEARKKVLKKTAVKAGNEDVSEDSDANSE